MISVGIDVAKDKLRACSAAQDRDRVDARTIAAMLLLSDAGLNPCTDTAYRSEELKSLTRYRFDKVKERAQLKQSVSRLVCILFPEPNRLQTRISQDERPFCRTHPAAVTDGIWL